MPRLQLPATALILSPTGECDFRSLTNLSVVGRLLHPQPHSPTVQVGGSVRCFFPSGRMALQLSLRCVLRVRSFDELRPPLARYLAADLGAFPGNQLGNTRHRPTLVGLTTSHHAVWTELLPLPRVMVCSAIAAVKG